VTTVLVPEVVTDDIRAGNTHCCEGDDPSVPEGALEEVHVGQVSLEAGGAVPSAALAGNFPIITTG